MTFKKVILLILFTLSGLILFFQKSEGLFQKFIELRQTYVIEKSESQVTFVFSKKKYLSFKDKKEIIVNKAYFDIQKVVFSDDKVTLFAIEDKNETFLKYISYSLKKESSKKNKTKLKRGITLALHHEEENLNNFFKISSYSNNFYLKQNKYLKVIIPVLKPPIV